MGRMTLKCAPGIGCLLSDGERKSIIDAPERPLPTLLPLIEDLVSVLIARVYKSAELTALLIWLNSHCNTCGQTLTNENQPDHTVQLCVDCA
jgi:hypothetical protein